MTIGIDARLWNETGVGRYTRNLVRNLQKIDNENEYFLFVWKLDEGSIKKEFKSSEWHIIPTNIKWHSASEQISYGSFLKKYNLDLMHFAYFSLPLFYPRPFVVTIHDLIIHHFPTGKASTLPSPVYFLKRLFYLFLTKATAKRAKAIITVSNSTKKEIIDHLGISEDKIFITYLGVENSLSVASSKKLIKDPYILYVGNAYPHKNLKAMIQAFKKVKKNKEKLVLVGRRNFFYERLEKEFNDPNIIFFGEASDKDLQSLYANANAFVIPSLMEGFGLPPLEAMKNSCFVIASDIPSIREVCLDSAVYFNPYDISDIADKIELAFGSFDKTKFIEKGKLRVKDFSWEKMAQETLRVYESCASLR